MLNHRFKKLFLGLSLFLLPSSSATAQPATTTTTAAIRDNTGFTRNFVPRNDDGSSFIQSLGFNINFFGRQRSGVYVNNNGNFTFDEPLSEYTPIGLVGIRREIIAGFWADVDTRGFASKVVTFGTDTIDGRRAFGANYFDVGYFNYNSEKLNTFQIVLIDRSDTGPGNFDIEFNYGRIVWETGDVSGGYFGFGGVAGRVGYSNGTGQPGTSFELTGSGLPGAFLDSNPNGLIYRRINSDIPGRIVFRARNGLVQQNLTSSVPSISFLAPLGGDAPPPQAVTVTSPGIAATYTVTVSEGTNWLRVTPASGALPANLSVAVDTAGLEPGSYASSIIVTPASSSGITPLIIPVELTVAPPASSCTYSVTPGNLVAPSAASTASIRVNAPAGCLWRTSSSESFVTVSGGELGSGNGIVTLDIAANTGDWRAANVNIANVSLAVIQSANLSLVQEQICRVNTIAGNGEPGDTGNNGPATAARLNEPRAVVATPVNDILIGDTGNRKVRKWTQDLIIRAFAGNGQTGTGGDGNNPLAAAFEPSAMTLDSNANLYIADETNHVIRKIDFIGRVTTIAGTGAAGFSRDGTPATETMLRSPRGVAIGPGDKVYIADTGNHLIRTIERDGTIKTVAGNGTAGFGGDGGYGSNAIFSSPTGLAMTSQGDLYIADTGNHRVRVIDSGANVRTVAGTSSPGFSGDNGSATQARLNNPVSVAVDAAGHLYIADRDNHRIRQVTFATNRIVTVGGNGTGAFNGDAVGPQTSFFAPSGVGVDTLNRVWVADSRNHRIRQIACGLGIPPNLLLPRISSVTSSGSPAIAAVAPFSQVTIAGENLAAGDFEWDGSLMELSAEAQGSSVRIGGRTAYLLSASPQRIVAIVPALQQHGSVPVEVTTARGRTLAPALVATFAPALFTDRVENADYVRASLADDENVKIGLEADSRRPAMAGERIVMLATGAGPTDPAPVEGAAPGEPLTAVTAMTVYFGEVAVPVERAAMARPGVYRLTVTVPDGVHGAVPVTVEAGGVYSQAGVVVAVH